MTVTVSYKLLLVLIVDITYDLLIVSAWYTRECGDLSSSLFVILLHALCGGIRIWLGVSRPGRSRVEGFVDFSGKMRPYVTDIWLSHLRMSVNFQQRVVDMP